MAGDDSGASEPRIPLIGEDPARHHHFEIRFEQLVRPDGSFPASLPAFARDGDVVRALYRAIHLTRAFDKKAVTLQRSGRLGTFATSLGQEAVSVGIASAMRESDVLLPSFREQGAQLWRGVSIAELLLYWGGDSRGSNFSVTREDFPVSIPIASHALHAVGVALAMKLRHQSRVAVCFLGDGATSKGDFYEAINIAAVWEVPCLFVVVNNQWAISLPRQSQSHAETLAQKGVAAGMEAVQVDGNDVLGVRHVATEAIQSIRDNGQPFLIEALTYRLGDHTTADDARRYRDDREVEQHWQLEPTVRLVAFLQSQFGWSKEDNHSLLDSIEHEVEVQTSSYLGIEPEPPEAIFDHLQARLPADVAQQRATFIAAQARARSDAKMHGGSDS